MVAGDAVTVAVELDADARCYFGTQSSTKVYKNPQNRRCSQRFDAKLGANSLLVLAPDPVQCFADSRYEQRQSFDLAENANLVLLDWFSAGRLARGERWQFQQFFSRNEIWREKRLLLLDAVQLDASAGKNKFRSGRFNSFATLILSGPLLTEPVSKTLAEIGEEAVSPGSDVVVSASPISGGAIVRLAAVSVADAARVVARHLRFIRSLLKDDPWARKW